LSSWPRRDVRSLTARVSSKLFFCLFRWKRNAMLRGRGSFPLRSSGYDGGVDVRGCNLRPGPGSCYLDGDDMQAITREINLAVSGLLRVCIQGCNQLMRFVVQPVARERRRIILAALASAASRLHSPMKMQVCITLAWSMVANILSRRILYWGPTVI
jgi:hypothetical protein